MQYIIKKYIINYRASIQIQVCLTLRPAFFLLYSIYYLTSKLCFFVVTKIQLTSCPMYSHIEVAGSVRPENVFIYVSPVLSTVPETQQLLMEQKNECGIKNK